MNRKWIIPFVIAVAAGVAAYGIMRNTVSDRAGLSIDRLQDVSFLARELRLNAAQASEIRSLHVSLGEKLDDCCMRHCAARARLGQALAANTNGSAQADIVLEEMCRAYEQSERATLNHIRAVRAVLNAEQKRRFDVLISDCMCKPCSMRRGSCRADAEDMAQRPTKH